MKNLRFRCSWGCDDPALKAIHKQYYRWWTWQLWQVISVHARGVKLGPLAIVLYVCRPRWALDLVWLNLYGVGLWYR